MIGIDNYSSKWLIAVYGAVRAVRWLIVAVEDCNFGDMIMLVNWRCRPGCLVGGRLLFSTGSVCRVGGSTQIFTKSQTPMKLKLFCKHKFKLIRIIYGDEIFFRNARQEWKCKKCGKYKYV